MTGKELFKALLEMTGEDLENDVYQDIGDGYGVASIDKVTVTKTGIILGQDDKE